MSAVTPPARVSASLERYSTGFDPDRRGLRSDVRRKLILLVHLPAVGQQQPSQLLLCPAPRPLYAALRVPRIVLSAGASCWPMALCCTETPPGGAKRSARTPKAAPASRDMAASFSVGLQEWPTAAQ